MKKAWVLFFVISLAICAYSQQPPRRYALEEFDNTGCMAKGRSINCGGPVMKKILRDGKSALPVLISQITETKRAKHEVADYWSDTRTGDVAFVVLVELFSDDNGRSFVPAGAVDWSVLQQDCQNTSQSCWIEYLEKHGRGEVRSRWQSAWNLHESEIHWNSQERCFQTTKP